MILEFNNHHVNDVDHLVTTVSITEINKSVPVKIFREGDIRTLFVTIEERN